MTSWGDIYADEAFGADDLPPVPTLKTVTQVWPRVIDIVTEFLKSEGRGVAAHLIEQVQPYPVHVFMARVDVAVATWDHGSNLVDLNADTALAGVLTGLFDLDMYVRIKATGRTARIPSAPNIVHLPEPRKA